MSDDDKAEITCPLCGKKIMADWADRWGIALHGCGSNKDKEFLRTHSEKEIDEAIWDGVRPRSMKVYKKVKK